MSNLSTSEKEEILLQRFVNLYKDKTYAEMCHMTLEIKTSDISGLENTLKEALRENIPKKSIGLLCSMEIIISRLIDNNSLAKKELKEIYNKIQDAKRKI